MARKLRNGYEITSAFARFGLPDPNQIVGFGNPTRAEFIKLLILNYE